VIDPSGDKATGHRPLGRVRVAAHRAADLTRDAPRYSRVLPSQLALQRAEGPPLCLGRPDCPTTATPSPPRAPRCRSSRFTPGPSFVCRLASVGRLLAIALLSSLFLLPGTAAARTQNLFPGQTVLVTTADRFELGCDGCIEPKPTNLLLPADALGVRNIRWTSWGSRRAVGVGNGGNPAQALKATVTFVASRPRFAYSTPHCGSGGSYSIRLYTRLSFTEDAFNGLTGRRFTARSHSNLAYAQFPFDC
jgi:hypothetical protein